MIDIFYISLITILILIIIFSLEKIKKIKTQHQKKLADLYKNLAKTTLQKDILLEKVSLDNELEYVMDNARKRLNDEIFDLQMDIFRNLKNIDI